MLSLPGQDQNRPGHVLQDTSPSRHPEGTLLVQLQASRPLWGGRGGGGGGRTIKVLSVKFRLCPSCTNFWVNLVMGDMVAQVSNHP